MFCWNNTALQAANIFVTISSVSQLYYLYLRLPRMNLNSANSISTHLVSRTSAGIGVLNLLHSLSVACFDHERPNPTAEIVAPATFALLAVTPQADWVFGGCLVYDLGAMAIGQLQIRNESWAIHLGIYAGVTAGIVGIRNLWK